MTAEHHSEYEYDLFWHALNYRCASTEHADAAWRELEACVERICLYTKRHLREIDSIADVPRNELGVK